VKRQEIAAARMLAATLEHQFSNRFVAHRIIEPLQLAQAGNIGNGFDVKNEGRDHGLQACRQATLSGNANGEWEWKWKWEWDTDSKGGPQRLRNQAPLLSR
jgi:hypothetical protein